ncbi:OLC1v1032957C1 [Oldenlandia corymbosa var. corymbosa]|uniref:OLC1v1032957C1 n=1 Tax=Oldenlandia corymbosa var. corymbosa TaxID=529605 RepID=A0AAV1CQF9_OLDCO|nr:OLC1v1032957C1 [Oldenlandia corymbosa var. corymbosa]
MLPFVHMSPILMTGTMYCDRKSVRSDVCIMKGDVRTDSTTSSVFIYTGNSTNGVISHDDHVLGLSDDDDNFAVVDDDEVVQHETIKPYTRKWERDVMSTVQELDLLMIKKGNSSKKSSDSCHCDVRHNVTALFFSTSGYTGNLFHEFNDGIVPLYNTAQHLNKQVVFVIVDYKEWWPIRYGDIVRELSNYPVIDFSGDNRTHCFPEAIVGLRVHDDLTINPSLMEKAGNTKVTIGHFREFLRRAYWPRVQTLIQDEKREAKIRLRALARSLNHSSSSLALLAEMQAKDPKNKDSKKPKLVIMARINGSREIINQDALVEMAEKIGFSVEVVSPIDTTELAIVYRAVSSKDVMVGVHGAALTHFLFMQPGGVFIQIIPLGMDWLSQKYFGGSTVKFGLKYVGYKISPEESSLYDKYDKNDPVLVDPDSVMRRSGWEVHKQVYLAHQNVMLNLPRFRPHLLDAYNYIVSKKKRRRGRPRRHRSNSPS